MSFSGSLASDRVSYTGREYDSEFGLYYYRARYYDPTAGRFISSDPLGLASGDVNLYRYVSNCPLGAYDPYGLVNWKELTKNPRVRAFASLGASLLAEYAGNHMEPGRLRGSVYFVSAGFAFASGYEMATVPVASFGAITVASGGWGVAGGIASGTFFGYMSWVDAGLTVEYLDKAMQDFRGPGAGCGSVPANVGGDI